MKSECTDEESEDLVPKCKNTGVGVASRCPLWNGENEPKNKRITDCSFYREVNENASLYAVFSGHQGPKVANMAMEGIAAEIMFGQLNDKHTDEEVHEVLRQAFLSVEKCYQASIDGLLAKYVVLQYQIDENIGVREDIVRSMEAIKKELAIGASAAICLIYNSRLFICNIGTCRVLLCRTDENQTSRVIQFSVDHNLLNEDELLRLSQLGVDVSQLRRFDMFNTRLIGYYLGKGGYKDCRDLATASAEPIISKPEIVGGITIDPSFQFLLLMSSGTCKYLHDIYAGDTTQENRQIVQMCAKELQSNAEKNLTDVAQAVIDKIIHLRKDARDGDKRTNDDLTILLRNFNNKRNNHVVVQERRDDVVNIRNPKVAQKIPPYVDFSQYYENVKIARQKGILPDDINFD